MGAIETVGVLLEHLRTERATSPRLIWYGPQSERVELSGRVLDNWVAKTSNLLVDELDGELGTTILLDLPPHWRTLSWALAGWQIGAHLRMPSSSGSAGNGGGDNDDDAGSDIIVTTDPDRWAPTTKPPQYLVAVALPALQMQWNGPLPPDTVDYAGDVRSYGDVYLGASGPEEAEPALSAAGTTVPYSELLKTYTADADRGTAVEDTRHGTSECILVRADRNLNDVLRLALRTWAADGSLILVHPEVPVTEKLLASERVTRRFDAVSEP